MASHRAELPPLIWNRELSPSMAAMAETSPAKAFIRSLVWP